MDTVDKTDASKANRRAQKPAYFHRVAQTKSNQSKFASPNGTARSAGFADSQLPHRP